MWDFRDYVIYYYVGEEKKIKQSEYDVIHIYMICSIVIEKRSTVLHIENHSNFVCQ